MQQNQIVVAGQEKLPFQAEILSVETCACVWTCRKKDCCKKYKKGKRCKSCPEK